MFNKWLRGIASSKAGDAENAGWGTTAGADLLDELSVEQLDELNGILDWNCFILDGKRRRFGSKASRTKRHHPELIPDPRITRMAQRFDLNGKTVLEIGCFEGIHTAALCDVAGRVVAVDSRVENVVKTMVRLGFLERQASVILCNVESASPFQLERMAADFGHHVGVLYHLREPVEHLKVIGSLCPKGLMLDTHYATASMADRSFKSGGKDYQYYHFRERGGYAGVFSGMYDHAKWLTLEGLDAALRAAGYSSVEVVERRDERNGPRCLIFASP